MSTRKQRKDSTAAQIAEANRPDRSAERGPDVSGVELLNSFGREEFDRLWRHDPERWTVADFRLLVEAASTFQRLQQIRSELLTAPMVIETSQGATVHPLIRQEASTSRDLAKLITGLGIRSRDGNLKGVENRPARTPPAPEKAAAASPAQRRVLDLIDGR